MKIVDFKNLNFRFLTEEPIILPPKLTPLVADPTVLLPQDSVDGKWHLWAHTFWGIKQYISDNGLQWEEQNVVVRSALRPFIFKEGNRFYLFYERMSKRHLFNPFRKWYSQMEVIYSEDLKTWSAPTKILEPEFSFHKDPKLGEAISNPCLVKVGNKYRLYFSCSLVRVPDCGFNEPLHISYAEADNIMGPYSMANEPIISPKNESYWNNLGAGSMKVISCEDGFIAFQNGIYEHDGKSGSAICILCSYDGINWKYLQENPLLAPQSNISWMASHIYACDPKIFEGKIYLYFNARNHAHWSKGSEKIGLAVAELN
jgi:hypothetical protein